MAEHSTVERGRGVWDNENGDLFMLGHIEPAEFIEHARAWWAYTMGDMDEWTDQYGEMWPDDIERGWWRPLDPSLTWETADEAPGEWLDHDAERATAITRYVA